MTTASRSAAGDAWAEWYARRGVWWGDPEEITAEGLQKWARQAWLGDIARAAGLRPGAGARVLEAGCGTGQYGLALALQGCRVDALDCNRAALRRAGQLAVRVAGTVRVLTLLEGDLLQLPVADNTYDVVFNQQVMEYFVDELERATALAEMVRATRPGGRVVVVVARPEHPFAPWWRLTGWKGFTYQPAMIELAPRRLEDELRSVGLVDVESDGIGAWRALSFWPRWYERWSTSRRAAGAVTSTMDRVPLPRWLRRRFGLQVLVAGTKPFAAGVAGATRERTGGPWSGE